MVAKEWSHLLTVERVFHIAKGKLLIVRPDFSVPEKFPPRHIEKVRVDTPAGLSFEATAQFNLTHFNIRGSVNLDLLWRLTVALVDVSPEQVPVGSSIFTSPELFAMIHNRKSNDSG